MQKIMGSKMPTFPKVTHEGRSKTSGGAAKPPRPGQKFYRGSVVKVRADQAPDTGYGDNGWAGASSVTGTGRIAANLSDMDTAAPGGDAKLDALIDNGKPAADDQTRAVSADSYPPSHGATRQQSDYADIGKASLPAKSGASAAQPVRKPN